MTFTIYFVCLGVGVLFTLVSAVFGHLFGHGHDSVVDGSHGHVEAGADSSDAPGVSAFSPTVIASFVTAFGGLGIIFSEIPATKNPWISAPLSLAGGFFISFIVLTILRKLFSHTQSSSESKVASLVGQSAMTNCSIPENGVGEIVYVQAGSRYTAPAREVNGTAIASGKPVKIVRIVGPQFFVTTE